MRQLFKPDVEAALQNRQIISGRLAGPHEPAIRHQQRRREVPRQMAPEQPPGCTIGELGTVGDGGNRFTMFEQRQLNRDMEVAR